MSILFPVIKVARTDLFEQATRLRTRHQDYLIENNPDYDPDNASYTDGEDKQPGDDLSPPQEEAGNESVYAGISDEPQIRGTVLINGGPMDQEPVFTMADIQSDFQELQRLLAQH